VRNVSQRTCDVCDRAFSNDVKSDEGTCHESKCDRWVCLTCRTTPRGGMQPTRCTEHGYPRRYLPAEFIGPKRGQANRLRIAIVTESQFDPFVQDARVRWEQLAIHTAGTASLAPTVATAYAAKVFRTLKPALECDLLILALHDEDLNISHSQTRPHSTLRISVLDCFSTVAVRTCVCARKQSPRSSRAQGPHW
jgi:hypothetical protein